MADSDYLANRINDYVLAAVSAGLPTNLWAQLYSSDPGPTNTGTQLTAIARAAVTRDATNFPASSGRVSTNGLKISWGTTVGITGLADATHVGFLTAATGGNLLFYGALDVPLPVNDRAEVAILPGDLAIER